MIKYCVNFFAASFLLMVFLAGNSFGQSTDDPAKDVPKEQGQDSGGAAAKDVPPIKISVAGGKLNFSVPGTWKKKIPAVNMIESEFEIPNVEGEDLPGRMTIMGAGGSVDANIDRWIGQFKQPDDSSTKDKTKIEKKKIADHDVNIVTISGTYLDGGMRPLGPKTEREDYVMLAAIVEMPDGGLYFIKSYGGKKTMEANRKGFMKMIDSLMGDE